MGKTGALGDGVQTALLQAHPWPRGFEHARRLEWCWTFDLDAPRARVWPLVADMSRLNRALGNPRMEFTERAGERYGRARYTGILHEWHELPWNWVSGRWYTLFRAYARGGMRALYSIHAFEDLPADRTRMHVYFGVIPRSPLLIPALKLSFGAMRRAYQRLAPQIAEPPSRSAAIVSLRPPVFELAPPTLRAESDARLRAIIGDLEAAPIDASLVDLLARMVRFGDELELMRIQVRDKARTWNVDEDALLRACLFATRAGLFELSWDVVCPHCRGVREAEPHLAQVPRDGGCEPCGVTFGTADAIEISFRVHPGVRDVVQATFCSAEPARKPHIFAQHAVDAGATARITLDLPPGRFRLRRRGVDAVAGLLDVGRADAIPVDAVTWRTSVDVASADVAAAVTLELVNEEDTQQWFLVEEARPSDLALKPAQLLSHPDFRDLFSDEYLAADVELSVGEQTILFTDIVGSTAMYAAHGDPGAFVTVRQHFTKAFAIIATWRGAVIKTIGDAVMAAFTDPVDAIRASEQLQRAFAGDEEPLRLRISLNTGACIAVRLNANLDYFGHTVNLAAKLQAVAEGGQIGLAEATLAAPGVRPYLTSIGASLVHTTVVVKGLDVPVSAWRWDVW